MKNYTVRIEDGHGLNIEYRETRWHEVEASSPVLAASRAMQRDQDGGGSGSDSVRVTVYAGDREGGVANEPVLFLSVVDGSALTAKSELHRQSALVAGAA